jgi:peptidoglycan hydrolase-like protein with peptidoglycan-binding domain
MRFFGYWTVLVALVISISAAYYSIVGLVAIFAASAIPVIIMGASLEVGKITTAVWLHLYGKRAKLFMRFYLTIAVLLLMFITSMGIFGFLSKAHIEQAAVGQEAVAQLERIATDITRREDIIARAESKISQLESSADNQDAGIQDKITTEEARIQTVVERLNNDIAAAEARLNATIAPYVSQQAEADRVLALISQYVASNDIKALQGLIGARQDGNYGPQTAAAVQSFREKNETDRATALEQINSQRSANVAEMQQLRSSADAQIAQSNDLINRLRSQLGTASVADVEADIAAQQEIVTTAELEIDNLLETKYSIEAETRKLEAEVGPVKYIAEVIYGDQTNKDTLEQAVRWVIMILVAVFDPLAVVLVIAGLTLIESTPARKRKAAPVVEEVKNNNQIKVSDELSELEQKIDHMEDIIEELAEDVVEFKTEPQTSGRIINDFIRRQLQLNKETRDRKTNLESPTERDPIAEMLETADPETLEQVYQAILEEKKKQQ